MGTELFFHHGWITVQTLSHPAPSCQVTQQEAGATNRSQWGRSCGWGSWGWVERALSWSQGQSFPKAQESGTGMFCCWWDWLSPMVMEAVAAAGVGLCEVLILPLPRLATGMLCMEGVYRL